MADAESGREVAYLESAESIQSYARARNKHASVTHSESLSGEDAAQRLEERLIFEITERFTQGSLQPVTDPGDRAKIQDALRLYETTVHGFFDREDQEFRCQPVAVAIDPTLPEGTTRVVSYARVISVSEVFPSVPLLVAEFANANGHCRFYITETGGKLYGCGMQRPHELGISNTLLDQLSAAYLFAGAVEEFGEIEPDDTEGWKIPLSQNPCEKDVQIISIGAQLFDRENARAAKESASGDWLSSYIAKKLEAGQASLSCHYPTYRFPIEADYPFKPILRAFEFLAREIFPEDSPAEAVAEFRRIVIECQLQGDFFFLFRELDRTFGRDSLPFFSALPRLSDSQAEIATILLSFFAQAGNLPDDERTRLRSEIIEMITERFLPNSRILGEYDTTTEFYTKWKAQQTN